MLKMKEPRKMINKVNLDYEYDKWRKEYNQDLIDGFLDEFDIQYSDYVEKQWQHYQEENELFDESWGE